MRDLDIQEISNVSGGTDAVDAARNACINNGLPADTKVTITIQAGGSIGAGSTNTSTGTTVKIETTCGDLTDAE